MPLNQPNLSKYRPNPIGEVILTTRSATRGRLYAGGTYFRSKERGEQANLIKLTVVEDLTGTPDGRCVVQHTQLKPDEQVFATGMAVPNLDVYKLNLAWNEEVEIAYTGTEWRATKTGIRWQIAPGPPPFAPIDLGPVTGTFNGGGVSFRTTDLASWPTGAVVYLRPRTIRYTLVVISVTDPDTMISTSGWDIDALRATLNGDATVWVRMPERGTATDDGMGGPPGPVTGAEDKQDTGTDATFLTAFAPTPLSGGDGLPAAPVGLNTGPDRVMVHLNYSEKDDGSMGELNQVFEWVGDTASIGSWSRYS